MVTAGIDAGSRAIKIVVLDDDRAIASGVASQGVESDHLANELYERLLREAGLTREHVKWTVATGCARNSISFADSTVTEITCHAQGVRHEVPDVRTIVEIGGQDSKLLKLDATGHVQDFSMNDRCAAGTGRFLEVVADRLGLRLDEIGLAAGRSARPAAIGSMCVVFAETEIIGLLATGASPEDIAAGVQHSVAARISGMAGRSLLAPVVFTGGVALIPGMDSALGAVLGHPVVIPHEPQLTGALGAAVLANQLRECSGRRTSTNQSGF